VNLVSSSIPAGWSAVFWLMLVGLFFLMWRKAAWRMLLTPANLNIFLGATVVLLGLWLMKAGVKPGLNLHLLGATALTLMFRPWFALLALALVIGGLTIYSGQYDAYPANLLLMGALPVSISWAIYHFVDRKLPNHFFIYIFVNCFFGAGLTIVSVGLASTAYAAVAGTYSVHYLLENYLPYYFLMAWAESFATGMIMTILVVYKPEWVATFDDKRYLQSK
jgi:uncharacterized membrane protein